MHKLKIGEKFYWSKENTIYEGICTDVFDFVDELGVECTGYRCDIEPNVVVSEYDVINTDDPKVKEFIEDLIANCTKENVKDC